MHSHHVWGERQLRSAWLMLDHVNVRLIENAPVLDVVCLLNPHMADNAENSCHPQLSFPQCDLR